MHSQPLKKDKFVIPKPRFSTIIDCFLASDEYNDGEIVYDEALFQQLRDGGKHFCDWIMDHTIAMTLNRCEQTAVSAYCTPLHQGSTYPSC